MYDLKRKLIIVATISVVGLGNLRLNEDQANFVVLICFGLF